MAPRSPNLPPSIATRTPAEYEALVRSELKKVSLTHKPTPPAPLSQEELLVMMKIAAEELDKLWQMTKALDPEGDPAPRSLTGLSLEEKLAMGEHNSGRLAQLAFKLAPMATLDRLEEALPSDAQAWEKAGEVIARVAQKPGQP